MCVAGLSSTLWAVYNLRLKLLRLGSDLFHCQAAFQGLQLCRTIQTLFHWTEER